MKNSKWFLSIFLLSATAVFADGTQEKETPKEECNESSTYKPEGWSFNVGGAYTWMSFLTPPTFKGSTGGFFGKVSYEAPWSFFGEVRSYYNIGKLKSPVNKLGFHEWYSEFVGGYSFSPLKNLAVTPYVGMGIDYIHDAHSAYSTFTSITLNYSIYYAVIGLKTHYTWDNWMAGLQVDCLPTFNQYIKIKTLSGSAWTLTNRVGVDAQLPVAYRYIKNCWIELAPYYRFFPIGQSAALNLANRNLNQYGALVTFRFFL